MTGEPQILVVDPDRETALEIQKMLTVAGVGVGGSTGYGVEALSLARQLEPDVVLLRIQDPLARPLHTLSQLKQAMPDVPIIVFSGEATVPLMRQAMISGAWDFLEEPLSEQELEDAVMRALQRRDEEDQRRRGELEDPVPHGTVITVFGAKGGIGKTTIASNLAISLATEAGQTVALVDMDTRFGDVAITMDIAVERSIADLARNLDDLDRDSLADYLVVHESGVRILPAPTRPNDWRGIGYRQIREVVDVLAQTHDFVILDTPGTFNEQVAAALEVGTLILLITTLDMASIKDTVLALEMLNERFGDDEQRLKIVLNRAGMDTGVNEDDVSSTLDSPLWWRIPQDNDVMKAAQLGQPIVMSRPNGKASVQIREMGRVLAGVSTRGAQKRAGGKLIRGLWPFNRKSA